MKPAKTRQILKTPDHWEEIPWGDFYREALQQHLQPYLGKLYGFHLLKIGALSAEIDTDECPVSHQFTVSPGGLPGGVAGNEMRLPFLSKSIDACFLAHSLSWSQDPHQMLREADRVLIDDGWIILTGFNPFSLLGAGKLLPWLHRRLPWSGRMFSQGRMIDWLSILNYEIICRESFQVVPWRRNGGEIITAHLPVLGCINLLIARKRTYPLTPNRSALSAGRPRLRTAVNVTRQCSEIKSQDTDK